MIKIEETEVNGFKAAIRGMRNPMNSWDKSDTLYIPFSHCDDENDLKIAKLCGGVAPIIGKNDLALMEKLSKAGTDHAKFLRFITVTVDITAPLYWWKEFDTYKVGTVANSCSTMHKIHAKEFTLEDFSHEKLMGDKNECWNEDILSGPESVQTPLDILKTKVDTLNVCRKKFLETKDKKYWWQMIQLLPSSYNQKRTVLLNYQVLKTMYHARKNHKLDCWIEFCEWIETLPYFKEVCIDA